MKTWRRSPLATTVAASRRAPSVARERAARAMRPSATTLAPSNASSQRPPAERGDVDLARRLAARESRAAARPGRSGASRRARRHGDARVGRAAARAAPPRGRARPRRARRRARRRRAAASAAGTARRARARSGRCRDRALANDGVAIRRPRNSTLLATPTIRYCGQRRAHARQRRGAIGAVDDQLGDHRVVERRDRVALLDAGVDAHAVALRRRREVDAACRSTAGSRGRDPRRRCAPRSRGRRSPARSCVSGSGSPAATRSCHSTRSRPVIISVTGCSTCSRVFISMK